MYKAENHQHEQSQSQSRLELLFTNIYSEFNENQWACSKNNNIVKHPILSIFKI